MNSVENQLVRFEKLWLFFLSLVHLLIILFMFYMPLSSHTYSLQQSETNCVTHHGFGKCRLLENCYFCLSNVNFHRQHIIMVMIFRSTNGLTILIHLSLICVEMPCAQRLMIQIVMVWNVLHNSAMVLCSWIQAKECGQPLVCCFETFFFRNNSMIN